MIKVFTTNSSPYEAGDILTNKIRSWETSLGKPIEIKKLHTNSNNYGWMIVIEYEYVGN
jgi:hypothetical protein